jgi:hypothetical protein
MATFLETTLAHSEHLKAMQTQKDRVASESSIKQWIERLTPLEERLAKLLATIPQEIKSQGLSLPEIRTMLAGKWRGKCHPGELGIALRRLGYERRRKWSGGTQSFSALWFYKFDGE